MNNARLGLIILTLTCLPWGWVAPCQAQAQNNFGTQNTPPVAMAARNLPPNQRIISDLKVFLDDQRQNYGLTPQNNPLLRDLQKIVTRHNSGQQVEIWNQGPGNLKVLMGNGKSSLLRNGDRHAYRIDRVSPIDLVAVGQEAHVRVKQLTNNNTRRRSVQFWDIDDVQDYPIPVNRWNDGNTLTPGQYGYQIHIP